MSTLLARFSQHFHRVSYFEFSFKIWHYSGALLYERPWNKQEELWEVTWQTYPELKFKKPIISFKHVEGIQSSEPAGKNYDSMNRNNKSFFIHSRYLGFF